MTLQDWSPWHEGKVARPLDQRVTPTHGTDRAPEYAFNPLTGFGLDKLQAKFLG